MINETLDITTLTLLPTVNKCLGICQKWNFELKGIWLLWICFFMIGITSLLLFLLIKYHDKGRINKRGELKQVTTEQLLKYVRSIPLMLFWIFDIIALLLVLHYFF
jgi:hypothetical protein